MPDLARALRAALPPGVVLGEGREEPLWPGEVVPGAVPHRLAEFARGRSAARAAMRALGVAPEAVPMNPDRSPQWPAGLSGSISHCTGACFAIAGLQTDFAGLGLDIEPMREMDPDLWPVILRPEEQNRLTNAATALTVFVAKEAAYKAQYVLSAALFDFQALSVTLSGVGYAARFQQTIGCFSAGDVLYGRLVRTTHHIAAVCAVPAG